MEMHTARSLLQVHGMQSAHRTGLIVSTLNVITSAARAIVRQWRQRRDILELQRMDDRLLADIGITRGEAENMVRHGRWGRGSVDPDVLSPSDSKRSRVLIWGKEMSGRA